MFRFATLSHKMESNPKHLASSESMSVRQALSLWRSTVVWKCRLYRKAKADESLCVLNRSRTLYKWLLSVWAIGYTIMWKENFGAQGCTVSFSNHENTEPSLVKLFSNCNICQAQSSHYIHAKHYKNGTAHNMPGHLDFSTHPLHSDILATANLQPTMSKTKSKSPPTRVLLPRRSNSLSAIPGTKLLARGKKWTWPHWPCVVTAVHNTPIPKLTVSFYPDHTFAQVDPADCLDLTHNEVNRVLDYAKFKPRLAKDIPALIDAVFSSRLLSSENLQTFTNSPERVIRSTNNPGNDIQTSTQQETYASTECFEAAGCSMKRVLPDTVEQQDKSAKARKRSSYINGKAPSQAGTDVNSSFTSPPTPLFGSLKHKQTYKLLPFRKRWQLRPTEDHNR